MRALLTALLAAAALSALPACDTAYADGTHAGTGAGTGAGTLLGHAGFCPPTVTNVSASSGTEVGGTSVTVTGSCFAGISSVKFGGVSGTSVSVAGPTSLTVTVPAYTIALSSTAASNDVTVAVTNPAGTGSLSAGYRYTSEFKRIAGSLYYSEFRFNDPAITTVSGAVSNLPDYNGNVALSQSSSSLRPAFEATGWNGGPSGLGDGTDDFLYNTLSPALASGTRPYYLVVYQNVSGTSNKTFASLLDNTGNNSLRTYVNDATNFFLARTENSVLGNSAIAPTDTNKHLFEAGFTASGSNSFCKDSTCTSNARTGTPAADLTHFSLFDFSNGAFNCNGRIAFALLLSGEPDATTLTNLRNAAKSQMWIGYTSSSLGLP